MMIAPFGSKSPRFSERGLHPGLQQASCLRFFPNIGPASYFCEKPRKHLPSQNWTRKLQLERFSANLGYRVPQLLERRLEESKCGGPGVYEIPTFLDVLFTRSLCIRRDVGFTQEKRFKSPPRRKVLPGPGSYKYKDGWMRRQWTSVCPFEWDGFVARGIRFRRSWELAPNRYTYIDRNSITGRVNKKVTERGPYDIFTGPRDESTIKNHFAPSSFKGAKNWLRSLPSELDRLKKNPQYGRWRKITQLGKYQSTLQEDSSTDLHRASIFPGPSDYNPIGSYKYRPEPVILYPFGSSVANARPRTKFKLSPGPGRYTIKARKPCHGHRHPAPIKKQMPVES